MHAKADPISELNANCLSDDEINNAILEYQQGGSGGNESDDAGEWSGGQSEEGGDEPDE